jgi:hypothetical protein
MLECKNQCVSFVLDYKYTKKKTIWSSFSLGTPILSHMVCPKFLIFTYISGPNKHYIFTYKLLFWGASKFLVGFFFWVDGPIKMTHCKQKKKLGKHPMYLLDLTKFKVWIIHTYKIMMPKLMGVFYIYPRLWIGYNFSNLHTLFVLDMYMWVKDMLCNTKKTFEEAPFYSCLGVRLGMSYTC